MHEFDPLLFHILGAAALDTPPRAERKYIWFCPWLALSLRHVKPLVYESGNPAALGFSLESGIPYGNAFIKNNYVGRTFIKPKQAQRESSVKVKLNVLKEAVAGKRVVMIDDSIVRGTTTVSYTHLTVPTKRIV